MCNTPKLVLVTSMILMPSAWATTDRPETDKQKLAKSEIKEIEKALDMFYTDCAHYPSTEQGLLALQKDPGGCGNGWGPEPYIKTIRLDPWGHAYIYHSKDEKHQTREVISLGADGREGGVGEDEDIVSGR